MAKDLPAPAVNDIIYVQSRLYIDHGEDDVRGGQAYVSAVRRDGRSTWVITHQHPQSSYNWARLSDDQEKLKKEYGNNWAHPASDPPDPKMPQPGLLCFCPHIRAQHSYGETDICCVPGCGCLCFRRRPHGVPELQNGRDTVGSYWHSRFRAEEEECERLRNIIRTGGALYRAERAGMGIPGGIDDVGQPIRPSAPDVSVTATCTHGITFDAEAAARLPVTEIRKRWPRGFFSKQEPCPHGCGYEGIYYASRAHYILGDW